MIGTDVLAFVAVRAAGAAEASRPQSHQVFGQMRQLIDAAIGQSEFYGYILAVDVSPLPRALLKRIANRVHAPGMLRIAMRLMLGLLRQ